MPPILRLFVFFSFLFFVKDFFKRFLCFSSNRPTENQKMNLMLNEKKKKKERKRERKGHGL